MWRSTKARVELAIGPHYGTPRIPGREPFVVTSPHPAALTYPRAMISPELIAIAPEVADALRDGTPVVALESTLISHGLPYPQNVEVATASEAAIRSTGAVPATVALNQGRLLVGLSGDELEALATAERGTVDKVSRRNLAAAIASGAWGATTVAATMIACHGAGIRVFATGGIGGVHRGALDGAEPELRHLGRPRRARPDPGRGRVRGSEGDPRRPAHARVPRDARRAGGVDRDRRGARLLRARVRPQGPAPACRTSPRPRPSSAPTRRWGSSPAS